MTNSRILILIPARYASSRFPGKPLAKISGKSMIERVYENCAKASFEICVVTDDKRIEEHVKSFGGEVCRVDDDVISGTERINLAYERFFKDKGYQLVINVQGDEPLLSAIELQELSNFHLNSSFDICTLYRPMVGEGFQDPNRVKVVVENGHCHYFSRSPIPYKRVADDTWNLHIGVYSYKPESLISFSKAAPSHYEKIEGLEQLRALGLGMTIGAVPTNRILVGVDTPDDITKLEGVLSGQKDD